MKKKSTQNKALIIVNKCGVLHEIKEFFYNMFHKKEGIDEIKVIPEIDEIEEKREKEKQSFMEYIKNISDEETELLKLQRQYRSGEIKVRELTDEQMKKLCDLFDKQINNLIKSNEEYRKNI